MPEPKGSSRQLLPFDLHNPGRVHKLMPTSRCGSAPRTSSPSTPQSVEALWGGPGETRSCRARSVRRPTSRGRAARPGRAALHPIAPLPRRAHRLDRAGQHRPARQAAHPGPRKLERGDSSRHGWSPRYRPAPAAVRYLSGTLSQVARRPSRPDAPRQRRTRSYPSTTDGIAYWVIVSTQADAAAR